MKKIIIILLFIPAMIFSLDLEESISLAKLNNKDLLKAKADAEIAYSQYKGIKGQIYPQLNLSGGYNLKRTTYSDDLIPDDVNVSSYIEDENPSDADNILAAAISDVVNTQIPDDPTETAELGISLKMDQIVYLGGKLTGGIEAAKLYDKLQDMNVNLAMNEVVYSTKENFYAALLAKKANDINQEALKLAIQHLDQVNDMFAEGLVSEYDKIRAELEVAKVRPTAVEAEKNYRLAKQNLGNFLGIEDAEFTIDGDIEVSNNFKIEGNSEALVSDRLEYRLLNQEERMRQIGLKVEKGNFLPNIVANAEVQLANSGDEYKTDFDEMVTIASVGIGFSMPIFTGGQNYYKIREAKQEFKKAKYTTNDTEEKLKLDIKNAVLSYTFAQQKNDEQNLNVELANKGLEIAQARFDNQVGIQLELLDAQLQKKVSELSKLNAEYQLLMAQEYYKKSIGIYEEK